MLKIKNNILLRALERINSLLDESQKKEGVWILFLLFLNVGIEIIGLGMIFPLMEIAINPDLIEEKELYRYVYEMVGISDKMYFLLLINIGVLLILILKNVVSFIIFYIQRSYCDKIALDLNTKLIYYYYNQGYLFLKNESTGNKIYIINGLPQNFAEAYMGQVLLVLTELIVTIIIIFILLIYSPLLFILLSLVVGPTYLLIFQISKNKLEKIGQLTHHLRIKVEGLLIETIDAFVDVTLINKERFFLSEFLQHKKRLFKQNLLAKIYELIPRRIYDFVLILGILSVIFSHLIMDKSTGLTSTLSLFALAAYRLIPSVSRAVAALMLLETLHPQITPMMILKGQELNQFPEVPLLPFNKGIRFKAISFAYPDAEQLPVLAKISLYVSKGETIGLIGESGSGKTTLLNILLRLIIENDGVIEVDGTPLNEKLNASFQKNIGYVPQEVFIKEGTLRDNIAFGEKEICEQRIQYALKGALLLQMVENQPDGLDMKLGEKGVKLSGGQKQRVSIARALYRQNQILVFDEPTSALDPETERSIIDTINMLSSTNVTIFIVAHRMTTLTNCDRIYELKNSQINRILTYQELATEQM